VSKFAFCESLFASGASPWHVRPLTDAGLKPGGGADTASLCGHRVSWDLRFPITPFLLSRATCPACAAAYVEVVGAEEGK
jgi:hypothetical protein